jgi:OOP family OmpA-OmpF porin
MSLFDELVADVRFRFSLGPKSESLLQELLLLIKDHPDGLDGFLDQFRGAGFDGQVASWLGESNGTALSGLQVEKALGRGVVSAIAGKLALGAGIAGDATGYALPKLVGLLTPGGIVPKQLPASILDPSGAAPPRLSQALARPAATSAVQNHGAGNSAGPWAVPFLLLAAAGLLTYYGPRLLKDYYPDLYEKLAPKVEAPKIEAPKLAESAPQPAPTAASPPAPAPAPETPAPAPAAAPAPPAPPPQPAAPTQLKPDSAAIGGEAAPAAGDEPTAAALAALKPGFTGADLVSILNRYVISFDTGSAAISDASKPILRQAAALIKKLPPGAKVHIDGYTDATGDPAANVVLSRRRAEAVRGLLIDAGVAPATLRAKGHGAAPASEGDSRGDRRIEFSVK